MIEILKNVLSFLVEKVGKWFLWFSPLAAALYYSEEIFGTIGGGLDDLHTHLQSLIASSAPVVSSLSGYLSTANFVFPVTEAFYMISFWITLRVTCVIIRMIKSFVPTVA